MTVRQMHHVGVVVEDLSAATAFFTDIGLTAGGTAEVGGEWVDRVIGVDGVRSEIVMLETPDGTGRLELSEFRTPPARRGESGAPANTLGLRHVAFVVDDLDAVLARLRARGAEPVGDVESYAGAIRLCYVRGPEGILVELAEEIG